MASSCNNKSVPQMVSENAGEIWLAGSFDASSVISLADTCSEMWCPRMGDEDLAGLKKAEVAAWSSATHERPWAHNPDLVWHTANLDLDSVVGFAQAKTKSYKAHHELLWQSIDGLETSNLSRLVRMVRDWSIDGVDKEQQSFQVELAEHVDLAEPIELVKPAGGAAIDGSFFSLLYESKHELLERKAGKKLWTWFCDWRDVVLSLAERYETLSSEEVFDLLKFALVGRRSAPRVRAPRQRQTLAERLLRLAESIAPNAPPFPSRSEALPIGAG